MWPRRPVAQWGGRFFCSQHLDFHCPSFAPTNCSYPLGQSRVVTFGIKAGKGMGWEDAFLLKSRNMCPLESIINTKKVINSFKKPEQPKYYATNIYIPITALGYCLLKKLLQSSGPFKGHALFCQLSLSRRECPL